ncbi:Protein dopey-1 [Sparganum proliferum]
MLRPLSVGVGHRPEATIRRLLMQPKGRLPPADTSGVIYRVTDKRLRTRVHENALAVKRKDVCSHVAMHSLENNHVFDFDGAQVLGRAESKLARDVVEGWQSDVNSINRNPSYQTTQLHGIPLVASQCSLLSLFSGLNSFCVRLVGEQSDRSSGYLAFTDGCPTESPTTRPVPLMSPAQVAHVLKELIQNPPLNMAAVFSRHPNDNAATSVANSNASEAHINPTVLHSVLLHFFYAWNSALGGLNTSCFSIPLVQSLLRDLAALTNQSAIGGLVGNSPVLSPISVFLLTKIFNEIISALSNNEEKRDQKELQEICQRLLEANAFIAGSGLDQGTWLRRTLRSPLSGRSSDADHPLGSILKHRLAGAIRASPLHTSRSDAAITDTGKGRPKLLPLVSSQEILKDRSDRIESELIVAYRDNITAYSLQLLSEHMAVFLDVVYRSEEKDRVPSVLSNGIMSNILPFLKTRTASNARHFALASQVLATLSSYQFTRRAWRKDVFDMLMDSNFFQMSPSALDSWCILVDNLMTQDKNAFKEALTRLTVSQSSGLNIFSSKEAEYEQRSMYLKKLNFIIYTSEWDQYSRSVSEVLERVTDNLRAISDVVVPVTTQVFLCTRVLISRISSASLASLWHIVIPELVSVFKNFADRLHGRKGPAPTAVALQQYPLSQLHLLLSACKLLATMLLLPENKAPQLLFHRWVFVAGLPMVKNSEDGHSDNEEATAFTPYISQIAAALAQINGPSSVPRAASLPSVQSACYSVLALRYISKLSQLEPFFYSLGIPGACTGDRREDLESSQHILHQIIEAALFRDFLEPLRT